MAQEREASGAEQAFDQSTINRLVSGGHTPEVHHGTVRIVQMDVRGEKRIATEERPYVSVRTGDETTVVKPGEAEEIEERVKKAQNKLNHANRLRAALARYGSENPLKHASRSGKTLY
jgi:hypothetical protein